MGVKYPASSQVGVSGNKRVFSSSRWKWGARGPVGEKEEVSARPGVGGLRCSHSLQGEAWHPTVPPAWGLPALFSQEEAGAETWSFYAALLRIQPQILRCWRPMRRAFRACDEGGTGLVGTADFRKVSPCLRRLSPGTGSGGQTPAAGDPHGRTPSPAQGPGVGGCPGPHFPGTPKLSETEGTCPSPADARGSFPEDCRNPVGAPRSADT